VLSADEEGREAREEGTRRKTNEGRDEEEDE
jgi:hypothetical protein